MSIPDPTAARIRQLLAVMQPAAAGIRALDLVRRIVATDRWNSFDRFAETAATLGAAYGAAGANVEHTTIPTGGFPGTGRWIVQQAMDVAAASLDLIEPGQQPLTDYRTNPWCVVQWAAATPPEGITCELRIVDSGKDLERLPKGALQGCAVLSKQRPAEMRQPLVDADAAVLVCDAPVKELPEATLWGKFGWGGLQHGTADRNLPAFMLSQQAGAQLRQRLGDGQRLVIRAHLDATRYDGEHHVVCGAVCGAADPQDEVWALAHSSEPGAVDNASGVAVCAEAARVLEDLIAAGVLPRPRRSIRFVHAMECYGFFEYFLRVKRLQPPLAGLVVDCVGARAEHCRGTVSVYHTVPSSAGVVNALCSATFREAYQLAGTEFEVKNAPFVSTEDTMIADPRFGFPCPFVGSYPYRGYHSSADTPELLDPASLGACAAATAAYLYLLADGTSDDAIAWAALARHANAPAPARKPRKRAPAAWKALLRHAQRDANSRHLQRWFWGGDHDTLLTDLESALPNETSTPADSDGDDRIPFRKARLAPTYENLAPALKRRILDSGVHKWAVYWADGTRTLEHIRQLASAETDRRLTPEQVDAFFEGLQDAGYVTLVPRDQTVGKERLAADLRDLGLGPGMDVMVHSSLSAIGWVRGGAGSVIDALLDVLGPTGTLLMPSFHHKQARVYNPLATPTVNGAIPDAFWRRPGVVRSNHPTHAVAALGPRARDWCENHAENGIWLAASPIGRLVHEGGYVLGLGVDHATSTAYHVGEVSLNAPCLDTFGLRLQVVDRSGQVRNVPSMSWRNGSCPVSPKLLTPELDRRGLQTRGRVGKADCVFCKAHHIWKLRREQIRDTCPTCSIRPGW